MGKPGILDLGSWCILRMASADTLRVFRSLVGAGLVVWTPIERRAGRMPRTKAQYDKEFALMPSYAFGHVSHLDQLLGIAMVPNRDHPPFTVFRYQGGIPLIADDQLDALRAEEARTLRVWEKLKRRGKKGPRLDVGTEVRLPEGPFAGIGGIVADVQGQYTLVDISIFGRPQQIKVASILFESEPAAKAA